MENERRRNDPTLCPKCSWQLYKKDGVPKCCKCDWLGSGREIDEKLKTMREIKEIWGEG